MTLSDNDLNLGEGLDIAHIPQLVNLERDHTAVRRSDNKNCLVESGSSKVFHCLMAIQHGRL